MKIGFILNVFGWQVGTFNININLEQTDTTDSPKRIPIWDDISDGAANRWWKRHGKR